MKKNVFLVFGTRPEAIKMYPVYKALKKRKSINVKVVITSQHQEMLKQVLEIFNIPADYDLNVMEEKQSLTQITVRVLEGLRAVFQNDRPDLVLVHGDTSTTFSSSLACFYEKIPVGHVEAGLRTFEKFSPYPEEMNRKLTDTLSDIFFAPTKIAKENLMKEGIDENAIFVTGNTVVDALLEIVNKNIDFELPFKGDYKVIVVTAHRRENWGKPMESICNAIDFLSKKYNGEVKFIFSVHKNPAVRETVKKILENNKNVYLIEPMDYIKFIHLLSKSYLILTDSGGIQEEAPSLKKPVLLLREVSERPEGVDSGVVKVIGTKKDDIINNVVQLVENNELYSKMIAQENPFGDGHAGERIAEIVEKFVFNGGTDGIF
jgi:UDP-N-acetylglucosamine 2-epimerase (non-hydrolysing)